MVEGERAVGDRGAAVVEGLSSPTAERGVGGGEVMRIERLVLVAAVLAPIACGTSGGSDGSGGGTPSGGGGSDDFVFTGGASSGGTPASGAAASTGGSVTASGGEGGGDEALDMDRVLRARKVRRRFSLGDRNDRDACIVRESGGLACSVASFRTVTFEKSVELVTFSGLGYCVIFDDQTVTCRPATSDSEAAKAFATSIERAEDVNRAGDSEAVVDEGGGVRQYVGPDEVITHSCPSGSRLNGSDAESCVLEPEGRVSCFWSNPLIADAPDKTEFDFENKRYLNLSQALGLLAAIDDEGSLRVRSKRKAQSVTYGTRKFVQVAASGAYWCMLTNAGELECDSYDDLPSGISEIPSGEFIAVDVNENFACAVRPSGEIVCWGAGAPSFTDKVRLD